MTYYHPAAVSRHNAQTDTDYVAAIVRAATN